MFFLSSDRVLGDSFSSIRDIDDPNMFDSEHGTALHTMQGNQASSCGEGEVSCDF